MSSFIKKNPRLSGIIKSDESVAPNKPEPTGIPGTTPSLTGASSLLASTGIPDLDVCLGGGLPPGCLLTAFEDFPASKANYTWAAIVRCFLAECYATASTDWNRKDGGWVAIVGHDISGILSSLPKPELSNSKDHNIQSTSTSSSSSTITANDSSSMKIAWRYEGMKEFDSNLKRPISALSGNEKTLGHTFDLGRKHESIPKQLLESNRALQLDLNNSNESCDYKRAWEFLNQAILNNQRSGLGRIVIGSLGAPGLWKCSCSEDACGPAWLVRKLSNQIEETCCIALVTIPTTYLVNKLVIPGISSESTGPALLPTWVSAVENVSDSVIELKPLAAITNKSATAASKNLLTREYDGFFVLRKYLRRPGSFKPFIPETSNLAFKIKRRRFGIEKFHLPPSIDSEPQQSTSLCSSKANSSSTSHPLDF